MSFMDKRHGIHEQTCPMMKTTRLKVRNLFSSAEVRSLPPTKAKAGRMSFGVFRFFQKERLFINTLGKVLSVYLMKVGGL